MARKVGILASGALLLGLAGTIASTRADTLDRSMYVTFHQSVALPRLELQPGTYRFAMADPATSNGVVRVTSADRRKFYAFVLTFPVDRPSSLQTGNIVTLGESVHGKPPEIRAWYPDGDNQGRHFIYPE
jgi:subtilisin family serine protease